MWYPYSPGANMSHLWKRKIIFNNAFSEDVLAPRRVCNIKYIYIYIHTPFSLAWSVKSRQDASSILTTDWLHFHSSEVSTVVTWYLPGRLTWTMYSSTLQTMCVYIIVSCLNISCTLKKPFSLQASMMWLHSRDLRHEHRSALHPLPLLQLQADVINLVANQAESTCPLCSNAGDLKKGAEIVNVNWFWIVKCSKIPSWNVKETLIRLKGCAFTRCSD